MNSSLVRLLAGLTVLLVVRVVYNVIIDIRRKKTAKSLGCGPVPTLPDGGLFGFKHVRRLQQADKQWRFTDHLVERFDKMSAMVSRPVAVYKLKVFGTNVMHTTEPKNIQALLATQFSDFCTGSLRRNVMLPMVGDGIFVQDDKAWEHSRAMLRPNFVREQISDLDLEERHMQAMMQAMPLTEGWTDEVNLQTLFFRLTLDSATEFLFGQSVNSQVETLNGSGSESEEQRAFASAFDRASHHVARRFRFANLYWLHSPKDWSECNKRLMDFADRYARLAIERTQSPKSPESKSRYIFSESLALQTQDPFVLRSQLLNILLAGRDTTASLLSFVFHHLVRQPETFDKLRNIILQEFGTYDQPRNISFSTLKSCTYLQHCINETLRLTTIVPGNSRQARHDTTLPRGGGPDGTQPVFVAKGTEVEYSIHVMHRRKDLWGPDADQFKPERWTGRKVGWEYLPFNGGPRICIGQQFAITEASYVIVRMLQRFDRLEGAGDELTRPLTWNVSITASPGKGPTVRFREAQK